MKVAISDKIKKGGPLDGLVKLLHSRGVEFLPYVPGDKYDVYLAFNRMYRKQNIDIRNFPNRIMYMGGFRMNANGMPDTYRYNEFDGFVFNSQFYRSICKSCFKSKNIHVIHDIGSLPADSNNDPILSPKDISGPIKFVVMAKWSKRKFKRKDHVIKLFNEFILPTYPDSYLYIIGDGRGGNVYGNERIVSYHKSFHNESYVDVFRSCHVHITLSPFDTGPKTLSEAMHYRIPFVCSNNNCGKELIQMVGKCGISIDIDPSIQTGADCQKYKPITNKKFYNSKIDLSKVMDAIKEVIDNYGAYTSWEWNEKLNYSNQADRWMSVLRGRK
jgi:glycosyltransferase involved in cell wall biosynthesis